MKRKRVTLRKTAWEVKKLKQATEKKVFQFTSTALSSFALQSTTPLVTEIFTPAQDVTNEGRIGRRVQVKHLVFRALIKSAASEPAFLRVVIFRQKYNQEVDAPVVSDLYDLVSTAGTSINFVIAPKLNNVARMYSTLYDKVIPIGGFSNTVDQRFGSGETVKSRLIRIPINKEYVAISGGGTNGRLYVITGCYDSAGLVTMAWTTNVYYTDM